MAESSDPPLGLLNIYLAFEGRYSVRPSPHEVLRHRPAFLLGISVKSSYFRFVLFVWLPKVVYIATSR